MALAVIEAVGALAGIVSVGMMIPSLLPEKNEHLTKVRVAAGLSTDSVDTPSGNQPGITLYDKMGRKIGSIDGKKAIILDGDFMDISVPFDKNVGKKPTEYLSIVNGGDDSLCIAYLALTQPDGTQKAWYGDVGRVCGADWYYSQLTTGDDDYQPACIWIDRNHSNDLRFQGFGMHINDFAATEDRAKQYDENRDLMCNAAPRFKMYENLNSDDPIPYFSPPLNYTDKTLTDQDPGVVRDKTHWVLDKETQNMNKVIVDADPKPPISKRDGATQPSTFNNVIISDSIWHSARELCESDKSAGHDFVSLKECQFCDMTSKKLWPLCGASKQNGCFDLATSQMRAGSGLRGRDVDTGLYPPSKAYGKTVKWG